MLMSKEPEVSSSSLLMARPAGQLPGAVPVSSQARLRRETPGAKRSRWSRRLNGTTSDATFLGGKAMRHVLDAVRLPSGDTAIAPVTIRDGHGNVVRIVSA